MRAVCFCKSHLELLLAYPLRPASVFPTYFSHSPWTFSLQEQRSSGWGLTLREEAFPFSAHSAEPGRVTVVVTVLGFLERTANQGMKPTRLMTRSLVAYRDTAQRNEMICGKWECPISVSCARGPLVFWSFKGQTQGHDCIQMGQVNSDGQKCVLYTAASLDRGISCSLGTSLSTLFKAQWTLEWTEPCITYCVMAQWDTEPEAAQSCDHKFSTNLGHYWYWNFW